MREGATLTKRQVLFDLVLVLSLSAAYVAVENLSLPKRWILPAIALALLGFAIHLYRRGGESLADFGFTRTGLIPAVKETAAFTLLAALLILAYANATGSRIWYPSMSVLLPIYPLYGLVQQGIFQGMIYRRLQNLVRRPWLAILLTSITFALVHIGDSRLVALTFVAGIAWTLIYSRHANLWPLGISHGLLAALAYPMILDDNPLQRF